MKKRNPNLRGAIRKYITLALALVITLASVTAATTAETHAAAKKGSAYWKIYQITLDKTKFTYDRQKHGPKIKEVTAVYVNSNGKLGKKRSVSANNYKTNGIYMTSVPGKYKALAEGTGKIDGVPVKGSATRNWSIEMPGFSFENNVSVSYANKAKTKLRITVTYPADLIWYYVKDETTGTMVQDWKKIVVDKKNRNKTTFTVKVGKQNNHVIMVHISAWISSYEVTAYKDYRHGK